RWRVFATTRFLPKPSAVSGYFLISGTRPVSISRRSGERKYDGKKHWDRVLDCGRNFSIPRAVVHQGLFQNEARTSVHPPALSVVADGVRVRLGWPPEAR